MASDMKYENGKISSLSIIALEYDNSNSDVEETEVDTNKSENQYKLEEQDKSENQEKSENQYKLEEQDKSENQEKSGEQDKSESQNKSNNQDTVPVSETLQQYRAIEENILSSCEETDSDDSSSSCDSSSSSSSSNSSTSSDSSSSDDDSDDISTNNKEKKGNKTSIVKKKKQIENEFDDLPPIEDLKINVPEVLCELLGEIDKIVEQLVIVKPKSNKPALHIDTVLFMEKGGRALGKILDVFGPVSEPNYCIRFNNSEHIQENNIKVGMPVYYCPNTQYTSLIFLHELHKLNSHDAMDDDELPEFSDDEEERAYYEMLKQKNNKDNSDAGTSRKRQCLSNFTQNKPTTEWQSNHPWNRNAKFQRKNQKRQQAWRNNSHFNLPQYEPSSYNDSWLQYQYQSNMHWSPIPRNIHPMFNGPHAEYRLPFISGLSPVQQFSNSSSDAEQYSQGITPNSQCNNMQSQYSRIPFGAPPRFNSTFPSFPMNYPQPPNASFSCLNMPYPSARPPLHSNAPWSSLSPPPPPPSTDSTIID